MEPPPFGDGNATIDIARILNVQRLQWSHRLSAMETTEIFPTHIKPA